MRTDVADAAHGSLSRRHPPPQVRGLRRPRPGARISHASKSRSRSSDVQTPKRRRSEGFALPRRVVRGRVAREDDTPTDHRSRPTGTGHARPGQTFRSRCARACVSAALSTASTAVLRAADTRPTTAATLGAGACPPPITGHSGPGSGWLAGTPPVAGGSRARGGSDPAAASSAGAGPGESVIRAAGLRLPTAAETGCATTVANTDVPPAPELSLEYWSVPLDFQAEYKHVGVSSLHPWQAACLKAVRTRAVCRR